MGRGDLLAFWFGEGDEVTPDFIRQAAIESLQRGEIFYTHNLGLPELRAAVADYMSALHGETAAQRFGDSLQTAKQLVAEAGLGLAPGDAFMVNPAPEARGWLRRCFASRDVARMGQGVERLRNWLTL